MKVCYTGWTWITNNEPEHAKKLLEQSFRECKYLGYDYVENFVLQHHSSKSRILQRLAFFTVQLSHPCMTTGKTIALTKWTFVGKVMSLL